MFKTIEECRLDLVAHSVKAGAYFRELDEWYAISTSQDLDLFPASAARVSFGNEDKTGKDYKADRKLMKYLADHEHMSPFEHQSATFLIEVPLFIRSQIHRHRTFAYNEISRRYTDESLEFWIPDKFRKQAATNRQASSDEEVTELNHETGREDLWGAIDNEWKPELHYTYKHQGDLDFYNLLIKSGVCREQARSILPQSLLTKFYMTGSLRNWAHFVKLRTHEGAQQEVAVVAQRIDKMLTELWPNAWGVLRSES